MNKFTYVCTIPFPSLFSESEFQLGNNENEFGHYEFLFGDNEIEFDYSSIQISNIESTFSHSATENRYGKSEIQFT